jgi:hypothetical protein
MKHIDLANRTEILRHLLDHPDIQKDIRHSFSKTQIQEIEDFSRNPERPVPDVLDELEEWLTDQISGNGLSVLTIGWDSSEWGPGGNGYVRLLTQYGLVYMESSDCESGPILIFDKDSFNPRDHLNEVFEGEITCEFIEIASDIYTNKELKHFAEHISVSEDANIEFSGIKATAKSQRKKSRK